MEKSNDTTKYGIWTDRSFIARVFKQWCIVIFSLALVLGVITYIGSDLLLGDTYVATATVAVVSKDNTSNALSSRSEESAVSRSLSMWNSSILLKTIQDANSEMKIRGTLSATSVPDSGLIQLKTTAKTAEAAYYLLSSAMKYYHKIDSNFDNAYTAVIMTRATGDSITVSRNRPLLFGVAGMLAFLIGAAILVLLWSLLTDVLHSEEQAIQLLEVPLYESLVTVNKKKLGVKSILITQANCNIDYLEGMDKLTSRVEQHMHHHDQRAVMVTSIQENEGKSTVAANLALNLARRGSRTLLIDLDLRRPVMFKIFDQEKGANESVSAVLQRGAVLDDHIEQLPDAYNLNVLWQYRSVRDSDRVLEKLNMNSIINNLKTHFDYIVIDTPPMGPVRDSEVIAGFSDCSLLVVRQDFCRAAVVNDVTDQLQECGAPCMGVILNNCKGYRTVGKKYSNSRYGYGNHYRRGIDHT